MKNRKYDTVNVNGVTIQDAEVIKTVKANIGRFQVKKLGVISYLFDSILDLTYIWLHVDSEGADEDVKLIRLSLNGVVTEKAIKHYIKSHLRINDITMNNIVRNDNVDKWLDTVIEYVNYQGNMIVMFVDGWYEMIVMTTQTQRLTKNGLICGALLETWVYGMFKDDKLIEVLSQIDYELKEINQKYPSQIVGF